jgi:hypothetical protein
MTQPTYVATTEYVDYRSIIDRFFSYLTFKMSLVYAMTGVCTILITHFDVTFRGSEENAVLGIGLVMNSIMLVLGQVLNIYDVRKKIIHFTQYRLCSFADVYVFVNGLVAAWVVSELLTRYW